MRSRIRDLREDSDKTQEFIANILGISKQYYSSYELGKVEIPIRHLITLAKYYNVSLDYLTGLIDIKRPLDEIDMPRKTSLHYIKLIQAYKDNPNFQEAINKLLDLKGK